MGWMRESAGCFCFAGAWAGGGEGGEGEEKDRCRGLGGVGCVVWVGEAGRGGGRGVLDLDRGVAGHVGEKKSRGGREGGMGTVQLKLGAELERGLRVAAVGA